MSGTVFVIGIMCILIWHRLVAVEIKLSDILFVLKQIRDKEDAND